ncbi:hypothetical protein Tco_0899883 [Tanacetum coccineum]
MIYMEVDEDGEENEHPALADSVVVALPAIDQALSAEETEPFETDESVATNKVNLPPHPAYPIVYSNIITALNPMVLHQHSPEYLTITTNITQPSQCGRIYFHSLNHYHHPIILSPTRYKCTIISDTTTLAQSVPNFLTTLILTISAKSREDRPSYLIPPRRGTGDHTTWTGDNHYKGHLPGHYRDSRTLIGPCTTRAAERWLKMAPKRATKSTPVTTTLAPTATTTTTVTNAQLQAMIDQGVTAALAARDGNRNGDDNHTSGTGWQKD